LCVADCIADRDRLGVPEPTEWQHIGNQIHAAMIFARSDDLSKAGWSWGCVSAVDCDGRTIWVADAQRTAFRRRDVRADEKLIAFLELQRAIHDFAVSLIS